jgi:F0F1-type ATP synthase membrane subunit b/b'
MKGEMDERADLITEQLKAAKGMLRQLEESLAKTQRLIEQTRQILKQVEDESKSDGGNGGKGTT